MLGVDGKEIKVGDTVKTQQPGGGTLPPAPPQTGEVVGGIDAFGDPTLLIRYKTAGRDFWQYIDLKHKINEVQNPSYLVETYALERPGKVVDSYILTCASHNEASEEARDILPKGYAFKITLVR
jgi:hypothetical protein